MTKIDLHFSGSWRRWGVMVALCVLMMLISLDYTAVNVGIVTIAREMAAPYSGFAL